MDETLSTHSANVNTDAAGTASPTGAGICFAVIVGANLLALLIILGMLSFAMWGA